MAGIPTSQATSILAAVLNGGTYTGDASVFVQLHTGDPGTAGTANVAANNTRKQITFAAASAGSCASSNAPSWTSVPASETYAYVSLWSALTAGSCRWSGPLNAPQAVTAGDTYTLGSGQVTVGLS